MAGIRGLEVFEGRPNTAGVPGLDVYEEPRGPARVRSPEARAWQNANDAQRMGPARPTLRPPAAPAVAPAAPAVAPAPVAPPTPPSAPGATKEAGVLRRTLNSLRSPSLAGTATGAGRLAGAATRVLGPAIAGAGVVSSFNDYKINDPSVDSSAAGTLNALRQGDFAGAGRSLSKGALETGMDLGSAVAGAADLVTGGRASKAYGGMLRRTFGDQLVDNTGAAPLAAPTASTTPTPHEAKRALPEGVAPSQGRDTGPLGHYPRANDTGMQGNTLRNYLAGGGDGAAFDAMNGRGGGANRRLPTDLSSLQQGQVYKTIDPATGRVVYSGRDVKEGATIRNEHGTGTGMLGEQANGNPNFVVRSSAGYESDKRELAQLIAERREREATQGGGLIGIGGSSQPMGKAGRLRMELEARREIADQTNAATLRGQDMEFQRAMAPMLLAQHMRTLHAKAYGGAGADGAPVTAEQHMKAAAQFDAMGLSDQAEKARAAAASTQTLGGVKDEQARKSHDDLVNLFRADDRFNVPDPKDPTKTSFDENGARRAAAALHAMYGEKLSALPADQKRQAAAEIIARQRLQDRLRQPEMSAFDHVKSWVGQYQRPADNLTLPNLKGATPLRRGATLISGNDTNDILIDAPDGRRYNAGVLTKEEAKVLRDAGVIGVR